METVKDILNFCNAAIFYDFKNLGIIQQLYQAHKWIINISHETIPVTRIRVTLSIIDDVILKNNDNDIEIIIEYIHDLGENISYMLSFEKLIREEQLNIKTTFDDNSELNLLYFYSDDESVLGIALINVFLDKIAFKKLIYIYLWLVENTYLFRCDNELIQWILYL